MFFSASKVDFSTLHTPHLGLWAEVESSFVNSLSSTLKYTVYVSLPPAPLPSLSTPEPFNDTHSETVSSQKDPSPYPHKLHIT